MRHGHFPLRCSAASTTACMAAKCWMIGGIGSSFVFSVVYRVIMSDVVLLYRGVTEQSIREVGRENCQLLLHVRENGEDYRSGNQCRTTTRCKVGLMPLSDFTPLEYVIFGLMFPRIGHQHSPMERTAADPEPQAWPAKRQYSPTQNVLGSPTQWFNRLPHFRSISLRPVSFFHLIHHYHLP